MSAGVPLVAGALDFGSDSSPRSLSTPLAPLIPAAIGPLSGEGLQLLDGRAPSGAAAAPLPPVEETTGGQLAFGVAA